MSRARISLQFLAALGTAWLLALVPGCAHTDAAPNVLLLTIDTLRADRIGAYGGSARTPHLDDLASKGVLFENAMAPMPMTRPSIFSVMTSLHPRSHGVVNNQMPLPQAALTLAEILQARGFETAGFMGYRLLAAKSGAAQGFDTFTAPTDTPFKDAGWVVDRAVRWLRSRTPSSRPYFLWVHLFDPHMPYSSRETVRPAGGQDDGASTAGVGQLQEISWTTLGQIASNAGGTISATVLARVLALYADEISYTDRQVGALLGAISEAGPPDKTIAVMTADHGECFENGIYFEHSECLYDGALRVPIIIRYPAIVAPGTRRQRPVESLDIGPTILRLAGIPAPPAWSGRSLISTDDAATSYAFFQRPLYDQVETKFRLRHVADIRDVAGDPIRAVRADDDLIGVRSDRWKYVVGTHGEELYDMSADSGEKTNVAPQLPAEAARLQKLVRAWAAANPLEIGANPPIDPETLETLRSLGYVR